MRIHGVSPVAGLLLPFAATLAAAEAGVPPDRQAHVLVRTLAFDRALPARAGKSVGVGVIFASTNKDSLRFQYEVRQAFHRMGGLQVLGRTVSVSFHSYKDAATLSDWIQEKEIHALYVTPGLSGEVEAIRGVCDEKKVASLAANRSLVEQGVAIGVVPRGDGLRILVNRSAAASAGMDLDGKLLDMAEVLPDAGGRP